MTHCELWLENFSGTGIKNKTLMEDSSDSMMSHANQIWDRIEINVKSRGLTQIQKYQGNEFSLIRES